jgi:hypothetical protein
VVAVETNTPNTPKLFERERLLIERMYKFFQDNGAKLIILDMPDVLSYELYRRKNIPEISKRLSRKYYAKP